MSPTSIMMLNDFWVISWPRPASSSVSCRTGRTAAELRYGLRGVSSVSRQHVATLSASARIHEFSELSCGDRKAGSLPLQREAFAMSNVRPAFSQALSFSPAARISNARERGALPARISFVTGCFDDPCASYSSDFRITVSIGRTAS
jgi:hypothetical protein